ncbi:MAG: lipocalin [Chitinivibrionales bacterium]|nr:lipocalin [Chitinivibrionales bacterium]
MKTRAENRMKFWMIAEGLLMLFSMTSANEPPFPPVKDFELDRYLGTWYEIARLPNWFEKGLTNVTATYSLKKNGMVKVVNKGKKDGKIKKVVGKAKFAGPRDIGHLKVSFFWIFYSDYIVVELADDYSYALVTGDSHDNLWILSRTPELDQKRVDMLVKHAQKLGFDTTNLYFTPTPHTK